MNINNKIEKMKKFNPESLGGFGLDIEIKPNLSTLAGRFIVPPFSILRADTGEWQKRKKAWLSLGIKSEKGRGEDQDGILTNKLVPGSTGKNTCWKGADGKSGHEGESGTSVFDPVLCELIYNWFLPPNGAAILDPFAGGSVRGVVSAMLGNSYTGIDLRQEQIEANKIQWNDMSQKNNPEPKWIMGNGLNVRKLTRGNQYDMIFTCPPYGNLEVYSDNPEDISTMGFDNFIETFEIIMNRCLSLLKNNRFACIVVGDFRDKQGFYYNFPGRTIDIFHKAGLRLYNEIILLTSAGSLPIRVSRQFPSGRKVGKSHQNVLVFYQGDPKQIKKEFNE